MELLSLAFQYFPSQDQLTGCHISIEEVTLHHKDVARQHPPLLALFIHCL